MENVVFQTGSFSSSFPSDSAAEAQMGVKYLFPLTQAGNSSMGLVGATKGGVGLEVVVALPALGNHPKNAPGKGVQREHLVPAGQRGRCESK